MAIVAELFSRLLFEARTPVLEGHNFRYFCYTIITILEDSILCASSDRGPSQYEHPTHSDFFAPHGQRRARAAISEFVREALDDFRIGEDEFDINYFHERP